MPAPETAPEPSARQLLVAAQLLASGEPAALAAVQAGLAPSALAALRATPDFRDLVRDCEALEAAPPEAQQARLRKLTLRAVERGLAEGRAGALAAALRLLGLAPARPPRTAAEPAPEPPPPSGERWGLLPDGDGGWLTPDGRPAMPGRDVSVIAAPGGPVRLVDIFPEEVDDAQLEFLEGLSLPEVAELNHAGRVCGYGEQWDPRGRTLWLYGEIPAPRVARGEGRDRPPDDAI